MINYINIILIQNIIIISLVLFLVSFIPFQNRELSKTLDTSISDRQTQELIYSILLKIMGIDVRIHNDVQQILNHTNGTSSIIDIVPHDFN